MTIGEDYSDWIVTVAFYAALHCFETLSAHDDNPPHIEHAGRHQTLKTVNRYREIWKHYRILYDASSAVRYLPDPNSWIPAEKVKAQLVQHHLRQIERSVLKLIGEADNLAPVFTII